MLASFYFGCLDAVAYKKVLFLGASETIDENDAAPRIRYTPKRWRVALARA